MRPYESIGIGLLLLLVPVIAWRCGRFGGRRDWSIVTIVVMSLIVALLLQVSIQVVLAYAEMQMGAQRDFAIVIGRRLSDWSGAPELIAFLGIFAAFLGMIGWSSVPARKSGAVG
jgi:hypothetical protein